MTTSLHLRYYTTARGVRPVADYINGLSRADQAVVAAALVEIAERGFAARGVTFRQIAGKLDERILAIRTVLELVEQRKKRRLAQRTIVDRMGVSQPVIAQLEKPLESSWRQPSLSVLSRYAAALGLILEVRLRPAA